MNEKNDINIATAVKESMGYRESENKCMNCTHSEEKENLNVDRSWYWVCELNPAVTFTVSKNATCNFFDTGETIKGGS